MNNRNNNNRTVKWSDRGCLTNSSKAAVLFFEQKTSILAQHLVAPKQSPWIGRNKKVSLAVLKSGTTPVRSFWSFFKKGQDKYKKVAFTLAEVLITLGIIGVIAAITIPAVIQNTQSQETVVKLKKAYNTLKMVERQATVDHGPMSDWQWKGNLTDFETFFKPYFDIMKDCGTGTGCWGKELYALNGTTHETNADTNASYYKFITSDGLSFSYWPTGVITGVARRGSFGLDLNGPKGPNKWGRDVFGFPVLPTLGIKPFGAYDNTTAQPNDSTTINTSCSAAGNGYMCAAKVLSEGAINY